MAKYQRRTLPMKPFVLLHKPSMDIKIEQSRDDALRRYDEELDFKMVIQSKSQGRDPAETGNGYKSPRKTEQREGMRHRVERSTTKGGTTPKDRVEDATSQSGSGIKAMVMNLFSRQPNTPPKINQTTTSGKKPSEENVGKKKVQASLPRSQAEREGKESGSASWNQQPKMETGHERMSRRRSRSRQKKQDDGLPIWKQRSESRGRQTRARTRSGSSHSGSRERKLKSDEGEGAGIFKRKLPERKAKLKAIEAIHQFFRILEMNGEVLPDDVENDPDWIPEENMPKRRREVKKAGRPRLLLGRRKKMIRRKRLLYGARPGERRRQHLNKHQGFSASSSREGTREQQNPIGAQK